MMKLEKNCPAFSGCKEGEVAVQKADHQFTTYGCGDDMLAGMMGNAEKKDNKAEKCCKERAVCQQVCGMTKAACEEKFEQCTAQVCEADQECAMNAKMVSII